MGFTLIGLRRSWDTLERGLSRNEKLASLGINRDQYCCVRFRLLDRHYVLNSPKLDRAIKTEVPFGTPKSRVVAFIQTRHPVAYDDRGTQPRARLQGVAENLVYRKDIVITFTFSTDGNLLSYSTKESLTFFSGC
jgi:hypothetical protein